MASSNSEWWAAFRRGLFVDKSAKHHDQMGSAIWLYGYLHMAADWRTGKLVRKYETISNDTGYKKRTLERWMATLIKFDYIKVIQLSKSLSIEITKWRPINAANNGDPLEEPRHFCPSDPPQLTSHANNGDPLNPSKEKAKVARTAKSGEVIKSPLSKSKDIYKIFEFWNSQNIQNHREINKFEKCINARLKFYTEEEIIQAIKNYKDILDSDNHFYSYAWSLKRFLTQTNGLDNFIDRERASKNYWNIGNDSEYRKGALDNGPPESIDKEREERIRIGREKYQRQMEK